MPRRRASKPRQRSDQIDGLTRSLERLARKLPMSDDKRENTSAMAQLSSAARYLRLVEAELDVAKAENEAERGRYRDLFHFAPDGYMVTDPFGKITEANRAAAKILHVELRFLLRKPITVFIHADDRQRLFRRFTALRRDEAD